MKVIRVIVPLILVIFFVSCSSSDGQIEKINVDISVTCHEVIQNLDNDKYGIANEKFDIVPDSGVIMECDAICESGESALSVFLSALRERKIHFDEESGYVSGISNIYAGDCGNASGWMFFINGELSEKSAADTTLKDSDKIEFRYIVDYSKLFE